MTQLPLLLLLGLALAARGAEAVEAQVSALLDQGRRREAELTARRWVADAPGRAAPWVLLARVVDDPVEARRLLDHALTLEPDDPAALLEMGRHLHARGASRDAVEPLRRASDAGLADASALLARVHRVLGEADAAVEAARLAVERDPTLAEAWLDLASADPTALDAGLAACPDDPDLTAARAAEHLRRGELDAATPHLERALRSARDHAEAARLAAVADCLRAGTLDPAGLLALEQARRSTLRARPSALVDPLVDRYPGCGVTWLARAADRRVRGDPAGALVDLGHAVERLPHDARAAGAYGLALHGAGRHADALPWLVAAADARPDDVDLHVAVAASAEATGRLDEARAALTSAIARSSQARVATALVRLSDEAAAFEALLRALERDVRDADTVDLARELGRDLGREHEVTALLERPRLPELHGRGDGTSEEVTVYARRPSEQARDRLEGRLERIGYGEGTVLRDRTVFRAAPDRPALTLWHDGRVDLQRAGTLPGEAGFHGASGTLPRWYTRRLMSPKRYAVLDEVREEIRAWRDALALEGAQEQAVALTPRLDRLWRDGVPLSGRGALTTPEARRRALLDHWATRTCDAPGWTVRDAVRRYLVDVVQTSGDPVTDAELDAANARTACGRLDL